MHNNCSSPLFAKAEKSELLNFFERNLTEAARSKFMFLFPLLHSRHGLVYACSNNSCFFVLFLPKPILVPPLLSVYAPSFVFVFSFSLSKNKGGDECFSQAILLPLR